MNLIWSPEALEDRLQVWETITADNIDAAFRLDELIDHAVRLLARQPCLGRAGRVTGSREWVVHENYLIVYEVTDDVLFVLALLHARRHWPS